MKCVEFRYKQGNATLDDMLALTVAINQLYRVCKESDKDSLVDSFSLMLSQAQNFMAGNRIQLNNLRKNNYVLVRLVESNEDPNSLTLNKNLRDLEGNLYEGNDGLRHRCGVSIADEGELLISKYGSTNRSILKERFQEEFQAIKDEDYGLYEDLIFEFFLRNLPLLQESN